MKLSSVVGAVCAMGFSLVAVTDVQSAPSAEFQIEQLVAELHVEPARRPRTQIANEIAAFGPPALPALRSLLSSPLWWVRSYTILAFGEMGPEAAPAVPDLMRIGADPANELQLNAISALGRIGPVNSEVMPMLVRLATGGPPRTSLVAVKALRLMGAPALPHVLQLMPKLSATYRCLFISYLGKHVGESTEALEALDQQVLSANEQLSGAAAAALTLHPRGCRHLLTRLDAPQVSVRRRVVVAMGDMGNYGQPYVTQLARALDDDDVSVRYLTLKAVESIDAYPPDVLKRVVARLDDAVADVRWRAVRMVGRMDNPQSEWVPLVEAKLEDTEPIVRIAAAVTLFRLTGESEPSLATLESLEAHESSTVRHACHEAFNQIRSQ